MGKPGKSSGLGKWSFLVWELPGKRSGGDIGGRTGEKVLVVSSRCIYSRSSSFCLIAGQLLKVGEDVRG